MTSFRTAMNKAFALASASAVFMVSAWFVSPSSTETATANGDTRTLHFYHTHTGESIDATFRVDGHYDQAVLNQLNHFLRDWRNDDQITMDPRLFDTIWEVYRTAGADQPIQIYSAYRSPETNAMLRRRSRAVAEHSQHMLGKAMDTTMPGMSMEKIREIGMRLQHGGVGYYQSANFVHLDVGGVRSWPRMSYDQLARLFPDGKTVHIPSNGQPMARYEEARAEIAARGGTEVPPAQQSQGFFAWLFGGSSSHEDENDRTGVAARSPTVVALAANPEGDETAATSGAAPSSRGSRRAVEARPPEPAPQPVAVASLQSAPAPEPQQTAPVAPVAAGSSAAEKDVPDFGSVIPLPPRRPVLDLVAAAEDLPLPPVRPDTSLKVRLASAEEAELPTPLARPSSVPDAIGGLIGTQSTPAMHRAPLPAIITQGSDPHPLPTPALAFAAPETTSSLRPNAMEAGPHLAVARAPSLRGVVALRGELKEVRQSSVASRGAPNLRTPTDALAGPSIYGLRRAAKAMALNASL